MAFHLLRARRLRTWWRLSWSESRLTRLESASFGGLRTRSRVMTRSSWELVMVITIVTRTWSLTGCSSIPMSISIRQISRIPRGGMKHCRRSRTQKKKKKKNQNESFQSDGILYDGKVVNFFFFFFFRFLFCFSFLFYFLIFKKEAKGTYVGLGYMVLKCVNLSGTGSLFSWNHDSWTTWTNLLFLFNWIWGVQYLRSVINFLFYFL